MTAAHTPGPWRWEPRQGDRLPRLVGGNGADVCAFGSDEAYYPGEGVPPEPADAALIAAAPEMLAACEAAEHWLAAHNASGEHVQAVDIVAVLHAAIAKAGVRS